MIFETVILLGSLALCFHAGLDTILYVASAAVFSYLAGLIAEKSPLEGKIAAFLAIVPLILQRLPFAGFYSSAFSVLGLSYFSLQIVSYLVDVSKGRIKAERNFISYLLYIAYFPKLYLGPIEKEDEFTSNIKNRAFSLKKACFGILRISFGLLKNVVVSARIALLISEIASDTEVYTGAYVLLACFLYTVQLYCDFSGAIDIVCGVSNVLGFDTAENFNAPFLSETVSEFWRRWHMTLGTFLKDYIYIPLGGSKKGRFRQYVNTLIVFIVSGIWHGSEYLLWGLFNGIFVCSRNLLKTKWKTFNRILTCVIISLLWVFFIYQNSSLAMTQFISIFNAFDISSFNFMAVSDMSIFELAVVSVSSLFVFATDSRREKLKEWFYAKDIPWSIAFALILFFVVILFGLYGMGFDAQGFIYSRF